MQGKKNILWPGKVKWYAKSSGTTNSASKYIPITNDSLKECHFKAGKDMLSLYANNFPNYNLYNGKGIMLGGSIGNSKSMYNTGDLSAILLKHFPFWVSYHRVPDLKTALMSNWEKKIELIADQAINENITLDTTMYYQFNTSKMKDYRLLAISTMNFAINDRVGFFVRVDMREQAIPIDDSLDYNYAEVSLGMELNL